MNCLCIHALFGGNVSKCGSSVCKSVFFVIAATKWWRQEKWAKQNEKGLHKKIDTLFELATSKRTCCQMGDNIRNKKGCKCFSDDWQLSKHSFWCFDQWSYGVFLLDQLWLSFELQAFVHCQTFSHPSNFGWNLKEFKMSQWWKFHVPIGWKDWCFLVSRKSSRWCSLLSFLVKSKSACDRTEKDNIKQWNIHLSKFARSCNMHFAEQFWANCSVMLSTCSTTALDPLSSSSRNNFVLLQQSTVAFIAPSEVDFFHSQFLHCFQKIPIWVLSSLYMYKYDVVNTSLRFVRVASVTSVTDILWALRASAPH